MSSSQSQLLELIRVSLFGGNPEVSLFRECDWAELYEMSKKQTVLGVVCDGLLMLPDTVCINRQIKLKWVGQVMKIQSNNERMNKIVCELFQTLSDVCPSMVLMKGQSIAARYHNPLRRNSGDIDLYSFLNEDVELVNSWAAQKAEILDEFYTKHIEFKIKGAIVENHCMLCEAKSSKIAKGIDRIIKEEFVSCESNVNGKISYKLPTCVINETEIRELPTTLYAVFLLLHMAEHFIEDGLGLRQVCDWAVFLNSCNDIQSTSDGNLRIIDREKFSKYIEILNLERLAHAFGQICVDDLGLKESALPFDLIRNTNRHDRLISAIFEGGNFGKQLYPWKGRVSKIRDMWLTMQVKVPRYASLIEFWPVEAKACYGAMIRRGIRRIKSMF